MSPSGKLLIPLSLLLLLPLQAVRAEKLDAAARDALLARLDQAREAGGGGMQADFTETKSSRLLQKPLVTSGDMSFQSPDKFRREITGANRSTAVSNGKTLWVHYPNFNEVEIYSMGEHSFFDDSLAALTAGLSYRKMPEVYDVDAYQEGPGWRLELTPKRRQLRRIVEHMTLFIGADLDPERTVVRLPKNDQLVTVYRNVKRRSFPASHFDFSPPSGATISRPMDRK